MTNPRHLAGLWAVAALAGCGVELGPDLQGTERDACQIRGPELLDLGTFPVGGQKAVAVALQNRSDQVGCWVRPTASEFMEGPVRLVLAPSRIDGFEVPASGRAELVVTARASGVGRARPTLLFETNDPGRPILEVPSEGFVGEASGWLEPTPAEMKFETTEPGCAARSRTLQLRNVGATPLQVTELSIDAGVPESAPVFTLAQAPSVPFALSPGAETILKVAFEPPMVSQYGGRVSIQTRTETASRRLTVPLIGQSQVESLQIDQFQQPGPTEVDVLLVVDTSTSMEPFRESVAANLREFGSQWDQSVAWDARLGLTSTNLAEEGGLLVGPAGALVLDPNREPVEEALPGRFRSLPLEPHAAEPLEAVVTALREYSASGANAGFLREGAVLAVLVLTSSRDASPSSQEFYLNEFLSVKGRRNTNLFSFSAVSGLDAGCRRDDGAAASPSPRLIAMAERTGGVLSSLCTQDWARTLEPPGHTWSPMASRFFLTNQPVISTIQVFVDDQPVPNVEPSSGRTTWNYDFSTNSVQFSPRAVPGLEARIRIEYAAACL